MQFYDSYVRSYVDVDAKEQVLFTVEDVETKRVVMTVCEHTVSVEIKDRREANELLMENQRKRQHAAQM